MLKSVWIWVALAAAAAYYLWLAPKGNAEAVLSNPAKPTDAAIAPPVGVNATKGLTPPTTPYGGAGSASSQFGLPNSPSNTVKTSTNASVPNVADPAKTSTTSTTTVGVSTKTASTPAMGTSGKTVMDSSSYKSSTTNPAVTYTSGVPSSASQANRQQSIAPGPDYLQPLGQSVPGMGSKSAMVW